MPGPAEVRTSDQPGKPELNVTPRRLELAQQGLTAATVGGILRAAYEGAEAGVFRQDGQEYDIVVRSRPGRSRRPRPPGRHAGGHAFAPSRWATWADLQQGLGEATILHADKQRKVDITASIADGTLSDKRALIDEGVAGRACPLA
ncbi:MAG: efflux RND transporter permease subunit [bacterium]|nr:efflux RND transporter permease subunit [bacterium]